MCLIGIIACKTTIANVAMMRQIFHKTIHISVTNSSKQSKAIASIHTDIQLEKFEIIKEILSSTW